MIETQPEFDRHAAAYEELLKDPLRDTFSGGGSRFFHLRKRDLLREFFRRRKIDASRLAFLDVGCGRGELLKLLSGEFAESFGCDPSPGMMESGQLNANGIQTRVQRDPQRLPFEDARFDFITAVCVYHHIAPHQRAALAAEVRRVSRPGGWFAIIEHNPYNPATRWIVSRTPVDANAVLLRPSETRKLLRGGGFHVESTQHFLYLPERLYRQIGSMEAALRSVPLGGQYAVFGQALAAAGESIATH